MSSPERNLVTGEGVDEGSAASATETGAGTGGAAAPESDGVLGEPPHGAPRDEREAVGPDDMETEQSRAARAERGSGQQLAEGEG